MTGAQAHFEAQPIPSRHRAIAPSVPRVFQFVLIAYVLLTGELVRGVQAALFGLQGGGGAAFLGAVLLAISIDVARIAPLFVYSRHPLGILHPLILTTVLWPVGSTGAAVVRLHLHHGLRLDRALPLLRVAAPAACAGPAMVGRADWVGLCDRDVIGGIVWDLCRPVPPLE